jgi:hypothetical protein
LLAGGEQVIEILLEWYIRGLTAGGTGEVGPGLGLLGVSPDLTLETSNGVEDTTRLDEIHGVPRLMSQESGKRF